MTTPGGIAYIFLFLRFVVPSELSDSFAGCAPLASGAASVVGTVFEDTDDVTVVVDGVTAKVCIALPELKLPELTLTADSRDSGLEMFGTE